MARAVERRPHFLVCTPGRLKDLLESDNLQILDLKYLVFDEADRLLDPSSSFMRLEIPYILAKIMGRSTRLLYFSATISEHVKQFHEETLSKPSSNLFEFYPKFTHAFKTPDLLQHYYLLVPSQVRKAYLVHLIQTVCVNENVVVFVNKTKTCEILYNILRNFGIKAVRLHSKLDQALRLKTLSNFRSGRSLVLLSTDVGSRGLDIPKVNYVINFELSNDPSDYIHRAGRASRTQRIGSSISFVNEIDIEIVRSIEETIGRKMTIFSRAPSEKEIISILHKLSSAKFAFQPTRTKFTDLI